MSLTHKSQVERTPFCRKCYARTMKKQYIFDPLLFGLSNKRTKKNEEEAPYDWVCEKCGFKFVYGSKAEALPT